MFREAVMQILDRCRKLHEEGRYWEIIKELESLDDSERTADIDSELARACNNAADPETEEGRALLRKAAALLKACEDELHDDYSWNFRLAYALFYLDEEGRARSFFKRALELHPGDDPAINSRSDVERFIGWCTEALAKPEFKECFRIRTRKAWELFAEKQEAVAGMIVDGSARERGEEIVSELGEIFNSAVSDASFEVGFNGEKPEIIFTPEGSRVGLFELAYFASHAPSSVLEKWSILVGRRPVEGAGIRTEYADVCGSDVKVWISRAGEKSFGLEVYCEKLAEMLQTSEGKVWWILTTLADQILGEIPHMRCIDSFGVLSAPKDGPFVLLDDLPEELQKMGADLSTDPESLLNVYLGYTMKPDEDPNADWRMDVAAGSTRCAPLVNGYLNNEDELVDDLHSDGIVPGFFCYPIYELSKSGGTEAVFEFRDRLEEFLINECGADSIELIGGASGIYCGYVDFIAWDLEAVLESARRFFKNSEVPWASFHVFRREAGTVPLKDEAKSS